MSRKPYGKTLNLDYTNQKKNLKYRSLHDLGHNLLNESSNRCVGYRPLGLKPLKQLSASEKHGLCVGIKQKRIVDKLLVKAMTKQLHC